MSTQHFVFIILLIFGYVTKCIYNCVGNAILDCWMTQNDELIQYYLCTDLKVFNINW